MADTPACNPHIIYKQIIEELWRRLMVIGLLVLVSTSLS